jgi:pyruvate kinase
MQRRSKIVCTIGPASRDGATLRKLLEAGMDVARLNFSHGTPAEHRAVLTELRRLQSGITIMQDLAGPKIRVGTIKGGHARLHGGERYILTTHELEGDDTKVHVDYPALTSDVKPGDDVFLADGIIHLKVEKVEGENVHCLIVHGGALTSRKGLNLPGIRLSVRALTDKDVANLAFGLDMGVDFVALSFVTSAEDIARAKGVIAAKKGHALVVSKIERREALANLDEIIEASDAVMVARGDLGVEIPSEEVPVVQKTIVAKCRQRWRPVIIATQMLESMLSSDRPTRADVSDIANAVIDGADALMLSAETATGRYPVESVDMMARVIGRAEEYVDERASAAAPSASPRPAGGPDEVCERALRAANDGGAQAIVCPCRTIRLLAMLAKRRPRAPIYVMADDPVIARQAGLVWGARALIVDHLESGERLAAQVRHKMKETGFSGKAVIAKSSDDDGSGAAPPVQSIDI